MLFKYSISFFKSNLISDMVSSDMEKKTFLKTEKSFSEYPSIFINQRYSFKPHKLRCFSNIA